MAEDRTQAPSAEELKNRIDKGGERSDLGAGDKEPDPATATSPPNPSEAGDQKRTQT